MKTMFETNGLRSDLESSRSEFVITSNRKFGQNLLECIDSSEDNVKRFQEVMKKKNKNKEKEVYEETGHYELNNNCQSQEEVSRNYQWSQDGMLTDQSNNAMTPGRMSEKLKKKKHKKIKHKKQGSENLLQNEVEQDLFKSPMSDSQLEYNSLFSESSSEAVNKKKHKRKKRNRHEETPNDKTVDLYLDGSQCVLEVSRNSEQTHQPVSPGQSFESELTESSPGKVKKKKHKKRKHLSMQDQSLSSWFRNEMSENSEELEPSLSATRSFVLSPERSFGELNENHNKKRKHLTDKSWFSDEKSRNSQHFKQPVVTSEVFDAVHCKRTCDKVKEKQHKKKRHLNLVKSECPGEEGANSQNLEQSVDTGQLFDAVHYERTSDKIKEKQHKKKRHLNLVSSECPGEEGANSQNLEQSVVTGQLFDAVHYERTSDKIKEKQHKKKRHLSPGKSQSPHEISRINQELQRPVSSSESFDDRGSDKTKEKQHKKKRYLSPCRSQSLCEMSRDSQELHRPVPGSESLDGRGSDKIKKKQHRKKRHREETASRSVTCNHSTAKGGHSNSSFSANGEHALNVRGTRGTRQFTRVHRKEPEKNEAIRISDEIHQYMHSHISKDEEEALKARGIKIRKGKWTMQEIELLKSNLDEFLKFHGLSDATPLLFPSTLSENEAKEMKNFIRASQLWRELGKGIHRELFLIYRKAMRLFDPCNYRGRFSEEEITKLQGLHAIHGPDWSKIGRILERTNISCRRNVILQEGKQKVRKGRWTDEETELLREAVRTVTNTTEGQEASNISWSAVATFVKTRGAEQCRRRWLENSMLNCEEDSQWTKEDEYKFIERLYQEPVSEECDVDWLKITKEFSNARSPHWLRKKWHNIKKNVPDYSYLSFEDIIDHLHNVYAPTLKTQKSKESV